MCHDYDPNYKPKGNIRYKVVYKDPKDGTYYSPYNNTFMIRGKLRTSERYIYKPNIHNIAFPKQYRNLDKLDIHEQKYIIAAKYPGKRGFHVLPLLKDAKRLIYLILERGTRGNTIFECVMDDFLAGGPISYDTVGSGMISETWRVIKSFKEIK